MSPELVAVVGGVLSLGGTLWWVRNHTHPDLVSRAELVQLELRLDAILQELRYLRARLDKQAEGG